MCCSDSKSGSRSNARADHNTDAHTARKHIKLVMLVNDVSLRNLIPAELGKGFGFFQSKPASAFAPLALTPDELGEHWDGARLHLPLVVHLNGRPFGRPNATYTSGASRVLLSPRTG